MKQALLQVLYDTLDLLNLWFDSAFEYYPEYSDKTSVTFYCRRNKYTSRKYFRTMRPIMGTCRGIWDDNEWIEYERNIDDLIIYKK